MKKYVGMFMLLLVLCLAPLSIGAEEPLVNINVVDANVRDILTSLADIGQVNLVADDSVMGKITVQITDTPFSSALDIVTKIKGLTYQRIGNVIIVGSNAQMSNNFGSVNIFKLKYARAADIADMIAAVLKGDGSADTAPNKNAQQASGRLKIDEPTNSLIFNGSAKEVEEIQKILSEIDIPYQQVSLEAQVLSINKTATKDLGLDWTWSEFPKYAEYTDAVPGSSTYDAKTGNWTYTPGTPAKVTRDKENFVGTIRFGKSPTGLPYEFYYKTKLSALFTDGKAKVLAKPKVITLNGKEAIINIGERIPIPTYKAEQNGTTTNTIEYKDVGIILKYTPRINIDGYITATVHTEVSSPILVPELKSYKITTRGADTQVRLKDGETMVIGGLIGKDETNAVNKVPFLGDLPLIGALFKSAHNSKEESEVVIFLTAHIVK